MHCIQNSTFEAAGDGASYFLHIVLVHWFPACWSGL